MNDNSSQPLIFDRPQLRYLPSGTVLDGHDMSGQPILLDANGRVIWPVTAWLRHLRQCNRSLETVRVYARRMQHFFTILYDYDGGRDWTSVDDAFLSQWKFYLCGPETASFPQEGGSFREIGPSTFNDYLSIVLHFYHYAQHEGWVDGIIGENDTGIGARFPISIERTGRDGTSIKHRSRRNGEGKPDVTLPPDQIFDEILAEIATRPNRPELAERDLIMNEWMRRCMLRRSEVARLKCHQIPSMRKLEAIEDAMRGDLSPEPYSGMALTVPIKIKRSKRGGERIVQVPPSLLVRTRQWIDNGRKKLLQSKKSNATANEKSPYIFISLRTGSALVPQSVTNAFKSAARSAELKYPQIPSRIPHGSVRPHHNRHAGITDLMAGFLDAGMHPTEAMLTVMEEAGIRKWETVTGYLHIAEKRRQAASAPGREAASKRDAEVSERTALDHARILKHHNKKELLQEIKSALAAGVITHEDLQVDVERFDPN